MTTLTANEKELLEMVRTAKNPEKAVIMMFDILQKMLDENSITSKITSLMIENNYSLADFAKAVNMSEEAATDIITGKTEPKLDEVIIIAKALNKEPEEIAQIFIDHFAE